MKVQGTHRQVIAHQEWARDITYPTTPQDIELGVFIAAGPNLGLSEPFCTACHATWTARSEPCQPESTDVAGVLAAFAADTK